MTEERVKRKLTANLGANAVSYSRLTGEDDDATARTQADHSERK
jgi:hypothetical protein